MPPDITDIMCEYLGILNYLADRTTLSTEEVQRALIDSYPIEPLNLGEGHIPQWDFEEIVQNLTGNPTTELVPFTDSELTELLFRE